MPKKLEKCVSDVKGQGKSEDSAYGICVDSTGEKPHQEASKPKLNKNRMMAFFDPPFKTHKVEPKIDKTKEGIGGTVNPMTNSVWKQVLDKQLKDARK